MIIYHYDEEIDLSKLSREELLELRVKLDKENDSIKMQIEAAEAKARQTNEYADNKWYQSAKTAKKIHGRQTQAVALELSKRKAQKRTDARLAASQDPPKITRENKNISIQKAFVDIARTKLDPTLFNQILSEAKVYADRWNESN
jgi:hypothetical protein